VEVGFAAAFVIVNSVKVINPKNHSRPCFTESIKPGLFCRYSMPPRASNSKNEIMVQATVPILRVYDCFKEFYLLVANLLIFLLP